MDGYSLYGAFIAKRLRDFRVTAFLHPSVSDAPKSLR
jgi:hypothetical protein